MQQKINQNSFIGQSIFVGIDVHKKDWKVSVMADDMFCKSFACPPDPLSLTHYLTEHFPGADYHAVYEAGFSGFWIQEKLTNLGVRTIIVNPADIPTSDKERTQKEDRRDSRKLVKTLQAGQLTPIHIPSTKIQQDRMLLRSRDRLVRDITRVKNRIKNALCFLGIPYQSNSTWSKAFIVWLRSLTFQNPSAYESITMCLDQLEYQSILLRRTYRQIVVLSRTSHYQDTCELLMTVPGVGRLTAMKLLTELDQLNRFSSFDQLCSYVGLVPSTHSSGEQQKDTGITPRGHQVIRVALMESAWKAIRCDSALLLSYKQYQSHMKGNRAIVKIAKKLLRRIICVWRTRNPYQLGVVR